MASGGHDSLLRVWKVNKDSMVSLLSRNNNLIFL